MRRLFIFVFSLTLIAISASAQQQQPAASSPVFKRFRPLILYAPYDGIGAQLWQGFQLIQKSNAGDPLAQHELGVRYFTGQGFPRDTAKAVYWIKKAADHELPIAQYNYGVFLNNGWGVDWNPFEGYKYVRLAADQQMTEAIFLLGLTFTDNMVVNRDMDKAYALVKIAATRDYAPAKEVLAEMDRRGLTPGRKSEARESAPQQDTTILSNRYQPVFLDFGESNGTASSDEVFLSDSLIHNNSQLRRALGMSVIADSSKDTLRGVPLVRYAANVGSPEALVLLGKWYEKGIYVKKDILAAAEYYVRAFRLDSPRAPGALAELLKLKEFFPLMKARVEKNDASAMYIWSALVSAKFDYQLTEPQALKLLQRSAKENHLPALIELGFCYYRGKWIARDTAQALGYWQRASELGSREARLRILAFEILSQKLVDPLLIRELKEGEDNGSVLSQLALAYCYQNGLGVPINIAEAARLYRTCAQRGNQNGYEELKQLYDALRPPEKEFKIAD
ncbi:MAG TPA: tetratricopeptide repeat protein [Bacteroidota bacterium]|nr:tetratricopeptide repeat protein [Bacteroidota bacterium]